MDIDQNKKRLKKYQTIVIHLLTVIMVIGGCIIALGYLIYPVFRITHSEFKRPMKLSINWMTSAGACMIIISALAGFAVATLKQMGMICGVSLLGFTIVGEVGGVILYVYLWFQRDQISTEDVLYQWKVLECHKYGSNCRETFDRYVYELMLPQLILVALAILVQSIAIYMIIRVVRLFGAQRKQIRRLIFMRQEAERMAEWQAEFTGTKKAECEETVSLENLIPNFKDQRYHTPSSILKGDHGYVPASGGSIDFPESVVQRKNSVDLPCQKEKSTLIPLPVEPASPLPFRIARHHLLLGGERRHTTRNCNCSTTSSFRSSTPLFKPKTYIHDDSLLVNENCLFERSSMSSSSTMCSSSLSGSVPGECTPQNLDELFKRLDTNFLNEPFSTKSHNLADASDRDKKSSGLCHSQSVSSLQTLATGRSDIGQVPANSVASGQSIDSLLNHLECSLIRQPDSKHLKSPPPAPPCTPENDSPLKQFFLHELKSQHANTK